MHSRLFYLLKSTLLCLSVIAAALGILLFPAAVGGGAANGISYCLYTLAPSLFPFMALSAFMIHSGAANLFGKPFAPITKFLFRLPGCAGSVILLSMIGGYPVGARCCMLLLEQGAISQKQAQRMLYFCIGAGPAFIISAVGGALLQSLSAGLLLFAAQIAAMICIGIGLGIAARIKKEPMPVKTPAKRICQSPLVAAATDASAGILNMSIFVILFSAFLALLHTVGIAQAICKLLLTLHVPQPIAAALLPMTMEITAGCNDAAFLHAPLALIAFGLGFGGFCVQLQILAIVKNSGVSKLKFIGFRFLHGVLAASFTAIFAPLLPKQSVSVFQTTALPVVGSVSYSLPAGIALVACCFLFLVCIKIQRGKETGKE